MDQNGHLLKEIKANPPLHKTIKLDSEWIPTGLVGSSMDFSQPLFTCPVWPQLLVAKFALKVAFHISGCGEGRYTSMLSDDSMIIYLCMRLYVQLCHCSSSWQHRPLDWTWNIARNTTPAASIYIYIHIYHLFRTALHLLHQCSSIYWNFPSKLRHFSGHIYHTKQPSINFPWCNFHEEMDPPDPRMGEGHYITALNPSIRHPAFGEFFTCLQMCSLDRLATRRWFFGWKSSHWLQVSKVSRRRPKGGGPKNVL